MARPLNSRITLLRRSDTPNADGGTKVEWVHHAEVFASEEPLSGSVLIAAQAEQAKADYNFRIRWMDGIKPREFRVEWDGRIFDVIHVAPVMGRRAFLRLLTREVV